jgi:hypothetical protein
MKKCLLNSVTSTDKFVLSKSQRCNVEVGDGDCSACM